MNLFKWYTGLGKARLGTQVELTLLVLPAAIVVFLFNYLPLGGLLIAFKDYKPILGILGSEWSGFDNFEFIFRSKQFTRAMIHTLSYNISFIALQTLIPIIFAILLYEVKRISLIKYYQTVLFMPYYLSWVVVSVIVYAFLSTGSGVINSILTTLFGTKISWYSSPKYWPFILPLLHVWKSTGYVTIIYYAGLMGIDPQLYESAELDGANKFQKIVFISIPGIMPIVSIMIILALGKIFFADFGLFFQTTLQSGPLIESADVINWFVFRALTDLRDYGMGTAAGLFQAVMGFLMIIIANKVSNKLTGGEHGLF
jgi:putative aldouronate transport system permease protein